MPLVPKMRCFASRFIHRSHQTAGDNRFIRSAKLRWTPDSKMIRLICVMPQNSQGSDALCNGITSGGREAVVGAS